MWYFPSRDEAAEVVHPGEEPFDLPASSCSGEASRRPAFSLSVAAVGRDHLDAVFVAHLLIELAAES
jgi:hypothetical protein